MRPRPLVALVALGAGLTLWPTATLLARSNPVDAARRGAVAAHVGPAVVTVGEIEDRLSAVPHFQLKAFGDTPDAIRRKFFDQIILPEVLYALAAEKLHLGDQLPTSSKIQRTLAGADTRAMMAALPPAADIPPDRIRAYFEANRSRYDTPERLYVFRILCESRQKAEQVLEAAQKEKTLEAFSKLAHDASIDKATSMRGGNLGYLTPDGTSSEAGLTVDPAVVKAAASVKDGELVPEPVAEKTGPLTTGYAVIWRRGTVPANHRTVDEAAGQIRESIWKEEADRRAHAHLDELRAAHLTELNESLLNGIEISGTDGDVISRHRPGEIPPLSHAGRPPRGAN